MNFDPTDEQRRWRDLARHFAQEEIRPRAAELDREQKFPYDIVSDMARLGLLGLIPTTEAAVARYLDDSQAAGMDAATRARGVLTVLLASPDYNLR